MATVLRRFLLDRRLFVYGRDARLPLSLIDESGSRQDCCDACPFWSVSRRVISAHRLTCPRFNVALDEAMGRG